MNEIVWGSRCPMCNASDAEESAPTFVHDELIQVTKKCIKCECVWADEYVFSAVTFPDEWDGEMFI